MATERDDVLECPVTTREPRATLSCMDWQLRLGPRVQRVGPGELVIGRASEADFVIADPLVSRRHAVVRPAGPALEIEDLGSRHGVRVNGVVTTGRTPLKHGDRIAICAHEIAVIQGSRGGRERATTREATVQMPVASPADGTRRPVPSGATGQASPAEVLLAGAEDALARGDAKGCEFALGRVLDVLTAVERGGGADSTLMRRYAVCALRAAKAHGRGEWIDAVLDAHAVRPRVMHAATADALEGALEAQPTYDRAKLRAYVATISAMGALGTYEQFCLDRLRAMTR